MIKNAGNALKMSQKDEIPRIQRVSLHAASAADGDLSKSAFSDNGSPLTVCEKMISTVKGIIFDFDGTLFDNSRIAFHLIFANPFSAVYLWMERLVRSNFAGRDFATPEKYYRAFFSKLGKVCRTQPELMRKWYFNHYMPRMARVLKKHYQPRPGADELLRLLGNQSSNLKTAVYSDYPFLEERMKALKFDISQKIHLYGPDSFGAQKPAPRPFLQIAKNLGLQPEEILVIGDREDTDGLGAYNAGMRFFCLETGRRRYFRLDPNRQKPNTETQGPTLLMYAGKWDGLRNLLMGRIS